MSMTPGPWAVGSWGRYAKVIFSATNELPLAAIMRDGFDEKTRNANAQAIAGLPSLIKALELIATAEPSNLDIDYCKAIAGAALRNIGIRV